MEVNVQLRVADWDNYEPQYEWQVVSLDPMGTIMFRSDRRLRCVDWLYDCVSNNDYKLVCVALPQRDPLSPQFKEFMREMLVYIPATEKIKQIKAIRAAYGVGLKEAKELMEDYHAKSN